MSRIKESKKNKVSGRMLDIMEVCAITGLSKTCITHQIHAGNIRAIQVARRFVIPGTVLLEYMKTPEYKWTKKKSGCYKEASGKKEADHDSQE
ncbi:MAG: helix-turn-helix domain-containing protein [Lachnospiraceae bacterium]|nr:helix-turn-helix domain-containing protein [Lachnospiraceae bacterium]